MTVPGNQHQQRFFELRSKVGGHSAQKAKFMDVGGNGDCGFRSVAAGLIDNFLTHPRKRNSELLSKLVSNYYHYFPQYRRNMPGLVTPADRMEQLINRMPMAELIQTMAYTLRQMTVTELCANPERYRGAFVDQNENTSPEEMRKPGTWIDESSIAALASVLSISIEVQVVDRLKTIPLRMNYNETGLKDVLPVVMKLEGNHYVPKITAIERFQTNGVASVRTVTPAVKVIENDPIMPEILAKITAEDERLVKSFEDRYHQLNVMVEAQELNLDKLLSIYVKGMNSSDYLSGRVACVTAEHGHQAFFDAIHRAERGLPADNGAIKSHENAIVDELIHAIARAISIGQMSEGKVFAEIEAQQTIAP